MQNSVTPNNIAIEKSTGGKLSKAPNGTVFSLAPFLSRTIRSSVSPIVFGGLLASSIFAGKSYAQCADVGATTSCAGTITTQVVKSTSSSASATIIISANASANVSSTPSNGHLFKMNSTGSGASAGDITFTQRPNGQDLAVTGNVAGIIDMNAQLTSGSANISVTLTGDISQANANGSAIRTQGGGETEITAADINASGSGIVVTGRRAITISAGTISAGKDGINITGSSTGVIDVDATQVATSGSSNYAIKIAGGGSNIEVNVGSIPTTGSGVQISNTGTGTITFSAGAIGSQTLATKRGVRIRSQSGAVNLNLSGVVAAFEPINISSTGSSSITITSTSTISATGSGNAAIYVNAIKSKSVNITVKDVYAVKEAIHISSLPFGTGETGVYNITINGNVTSTHTGETDSTILLTQGLQVGSTTIVVASGATVRNSGGTAINFFRVPLGSPRHETEEVNITISGNVYGNHTGIYTNPIGNLTVITSGIISASRTISTSRGVTLNLGASGKTTKMTVNGGRIEGQYASITTIFGGATTITLNSGTLSGRVFTRDGNDKLTLNSGSIGTSELDGGTEDRSNSYIIDQDILEFNNSWSLGLSQIKDWENIYVNSGATVTITGSGNIQTEDVHVSGTLSFSNNATTDQMTMIGLENRARNARRDTNLRGTGTIVVDVNLSTGTSDSITVNGNIVGNKKIKLTDITPAASTSRTSSEITVITATKDIVAANFELENNNKFGSGGYVYTLNFKSASKSFVLRRSSGTIQCVESTTATGTFNCAGAINNQEWISNVSSGVSVAVNINSTATVNISAQRGFFINHYNAISITQAASGSNLVAGAGSRGLIYAYARRASYTPGNGLSITLTGSASFAGSGTAIYGRSTGGVNTVTISVADVVASHSAGNALSIKGGGIVTVNTKAVSAGGTAVSVQTDGSTQSVTVTTTGAITASNGRGIYTKSRSGDITINTTSVSGSTVGIEAVASGNGDINISVSGNVQGSDSGSVGISTSTNGGTATIKIHSGTITGNSSAISDANNDSSVILYSGAVISANISLGGGDDTLTLSGGTRNSNVVFSGGTNSGTTPENDTIVFNAGSTAWDASKFTLFEKITIGSSGTLTFNNTTNLTGIALSLDGTASLSDSAVGDTLIIGGSLSGPTATTGGIFHIDVNFQSGASDTITVGGNVTGQHVIQINNVTPSDATTVSSNPITVFSVTGTVTASAISVESGSVGVGGRIFQLTFNSSSKTFTLVTRPGATECAESTTVTGNFTCDGTINTSEYMVAFTSSNITATLDDSATVNVQSGLAFYLSGRGNLSFTQEASGNQITGSGSATGLVHANTSANGNIAITLTSTASLASSGTAIKATTTGTGNVTISAINVTASHASGTAIEASASGGNIEISAATIVGGKAGIVAKNMGTSGAITINISQTISSSDGLGIDAYNNGQGNILISTIGNISAKSEGIKAVSKNSGNISINASGAITNNESSNSNGILARISGDDSVGNITIVANDVTASKHAIEAEHEGSGSISVTVSGDILVTTTNTASLAAIYVHNESDGDDILVITQSGSTVSGSYGIFVEQNGTGSVTITSNGEATGTSTDGIKAYTSIGTDLKLSAHTVSGGRHGIYVQHEGNGSANVTILSGGSVTGKTDGIKILSETSAATTISASGPITGTDRHGIRVDFGSVTGNVSVDVMSVTGGKDGVYVGLSGSGGGNISISTRGEITAGDRGVTASQKGSGAGNVSITTSAAVTANSGNAIYAYNKNGAITVDTSGTLTGSVDGIKVVNKHSGASSATVTVNGNVTGTNGNGIDLYSSSQGNLKLTATGDVTGKNYGIIAANKTSGDLEINVTGTVSNQSASAKDGVRATNEGAGNLAVTTTVVTGDDEGIEIRGLGTGTLAATLNGAVTGSGSGDTDAGILIYNKAGGGATTLTVGSSGTVQGSNGILIDNKSSSTTTVNVSGAVTGRTEDGIDVTAQSGRLSIIVGANITGANNKVGIDTHTDGGITSITLNSGTVTSVSGTAIQNDEGNSTVTVNSGATIGANVSLGGGVDVLTLSGGSIAASVTLDGGSDSGTDTSVDVINFESATTTLTGISIRNWERVTVGSGSTVVFDGTNSLTATQFNVAGTLSMRDNSPGDELELTGTLSGNSILYIDANFGTGSVDTLSVRGNISGVITIEVNDVTTADARRTENPITVVTVTGTATANSVNLGLGKNIRSGNYFYTLSFNSSTKTYVLNGEVGTTYCQTTTGGINYACSGAIDAQENLIAAGDNDVTATLNRTATVNVSEFTAFALSGRKNITFTQDASGNTLNATGSATGVIHANTAGSGNIAITLTGTATLQGSGTAIRVTSTGSGSSINVRVTDVTASNARATAISVSASNPEIDINAGTVTGGNAAITAVSSSSVRISVSGAVSSSGNTAINAMTVASGNIIVATSGTVTASNVSGTAIMATGNGNSIAVFASGGATAGSEAIVAINSSTGSVRVSTNGSVSSSGNTAIRVTSSGEVDVDSSGSVVASDASGTAIMATGNGATVSVRAAAASAGLEAIHAVNTSTGSVAVVTTGVVTSSGASAIRATSSGNVTVNTSGNVTGNNIGIHANVASLTTANIRVSAAATVIGQTRAGIYVSNRARGSITVSARNATGQTDGVLAVHTGTGAIIVNTTGAIAGTTEYGLNLRTNRNGTNVNVTTRSSVSGAKGGILVSHSGNGTVSVNAGGTVSSSAAGNHGISVDHTGTGNISIVVSGAVTGGSGGVGVYGKTRSGSTTIVLNSGAVISSAGGTAIRHGSGNSSITLNQGATISGIVELGGGTDTLTISGGTVRASRLDGGEDQGADRSVDVLTFASGSSSLNSSRFVNWERISFAAASTVSVNGTITVDTNEVDLKGTLSMQDGQANDSFTVNGNLAGGGTLRIDVDFASGASDSISVSGNATGTTTIAIADITPASANSRTSSITIATVNGESSASTFTIAGGAQFLSAGYLYSMSYDDASNSYQIRGTSIVGSLLLSTPIALFDGFAKAPSLHQRLGGIDSQRLSGSKQPKIWMRTISRNNEYSKSNVLNASYDNSTLGFQIGSDSVLFENDKGVWVMGFNLSSYKVESTVTLNAISGDLEASGFGIGSTSTWYGKSGHFVDIQLQVNRITTDIDTSILPDLVDADASTAIYFSSEFGYLIASPSDINIYAQAQLSWGHVGLGNIKTSAGEITLHMEDGFTVRAGIHAEYKQDNLNWYASGNIIADTPDHWFTRFGDETFLDVTSAMLAEINAGISSQVTDNTSLFAQANFSTSIDGRDNSRNSNGISAGIKYSW